MRILYIAHSFGAWGSDNRIWDYNLRDTLWQMGHELLDPPFNASKAHTECSKDSSGKARAKYSDLLLKSIKKSLNHRCPDLMFTYFDNRNVEPGAIDEIRKLGIMTVNFYCNAAHQFDQVAEVASHFDYCMVPEKQALPKYKSIGAQPIHVQMAANPSFYRRFDLAKEFDAVFVGGKYLNREAYLIEVHKRGIDVRAFGDGWRRLPPPLRVVPIHSFPRRLLGVVKRQLLGIVAESRSRRLPLCNYFPPIGDEEMIAVYNKTRVVLGLSDVYDTAGNILRHIRLRDFEVPMCGSFYITGYQEELSEYYEIGKEIECYHSKEELADKVRYYLAHPDQRETIAQRGHMRALREHTWEKRFKKVFEAVGLKA